MTPESLTARAADFVQSSALNRVAPQQALTPELAGLRLFDPPLLAFGAAQDPGFAALKGPEAIGHHFMAPTEWLAGANTVVCFFMPYTETIRAANRQNYTWPAEEWLHGRIEGRVLVNALAAWLAETLQAEGFAALAPTADPRFFSVTGGEKIYGGKTLTFTSNWSERHVAYTCGLGTFGLSKGIITEQGMAGQLGSVVTAWQAPPTPKAYAGLYEYCIQCGLCAKHCPAGAISPETGKAHPPCSGFIDQTLAKYRPRYGCGKCQVGVPCEGGVPGRG